ncbi:TSUP family transporter, partial [Rhodococcus sp. NPDC058514]
MAWLDWGVLMVAATAAGWVDAVVGGGGLILLPAILITMPQLSPQVALATNKLTAINGTAAAVLTFSRKVAMQWRLMIPAAVLAAAFAGLGAAAVSLIDKALFIPIIMVLLVAVAAIVTMRPTLGTT